MGQPIFLLRADGRDPVPAERAFIESLNTCCHAAHIEGCCAVEPVTV